MAKDLRRRIVNKYDKIVSDAKYRMELDQKHNRHNSDMCERSQRWYNMVLKFKTNFVDKLTKDDIQYYRSVFVDDEVILQATGYGKIFNEDKTVNIEYIKSQFPNNVDRILKPSLITQENNK